MGHIRLGPLPKTREWQEVVRLLGDGASIVAIAEASANAARAGLEQARSDIGLVEAFLLLTQIPRDRETLRALQLPPFAEPLDVGVGLSRILDERLEGNRHRTDVGEMAQLAAIETVVDLVARRIPRLLAPEAGSVERALTSFGPQRQFALLTRAFFARFLERYLSYYLSRQLGTLVGQKKRFASTEDHTAFNEALTRHCYETARIVEDYAGAWRSKKQWEGTISRREVTAFTQHAVQKLTGELKRREVRDVG